MASGAESTGLLTQATILMGVAVVLVPLAKRFGIATVLGYLLAGVIVGPSALNLINHSEDVMHFAELGVVMLLFIIGLELEPSRLWALRRSIFMLGSMQVGATALALFAVFFGVLGLSLIQALIISLTLALSSTAFVLQLLSEKKQLGTTHGREAFSILLFQDMAVIPLLIMIPFLSGGDGQDYDLEYFLTLIAVISAFVIGSRVIVRPFFKFVSDSGASELLTAVALFIVLGASLAMANLGISMALGAFLTGVLLADSPYRHELEASIEPFKGLLLGLFFMSVGMNAEIGLIVEHPFWIIGGALGLMFIKGAVLAVIARLSGNRWPTSIRLGFVLAQGGEFAFVILGEALQFEVLDTELGNMLMMMVTASMALTPLAFLFLERVLDPMLKEQKKTPEFDSIPDNHPPVIIAGFGRFGQIIGRVLKMRGIDFTAIEKSARRVDFVRKFGNEIYYGDPNNPELLKAAGIAHAKLFILAIDNVERSVKSAFFLRKTYPNLTVVARARDRHHYYLLKEAGVEHIWRETYLSSLDLAQRSLQILGLSPDQAQKTVELFREYDERLLVRQQAVYNDEASLIETAKEAAHELESLFDSDSNLQRSDPLTGMMDALKQDDLNNDAPR